MKLTEIMRLVVINFMENKVKMLLTSLGIIVGASTIVLVIAIGQGSRADVADQFKNLNAGAIDVAIGDGVDMDAMMGGMGGFDMGGFDMGNMPSFGAGGTGSMPSFGGGSSGSMPSFGGSSGSMPSFGGTGGGMPGSISGGGSSSRKTSGAASNARGQTIKLAASDVADIETYIDGLSQVTIYQSGSTAVYGGDMSAEADKTVVGVTANYKDVSNLGVLYGSFIDEYNNDGSEYVAVIGYSLAEEMFTYAAYAYGDYVQIDGKNYEIIGVLESMGSVSSGINPDDVIFVPYNTAEKHIFGGTGEPKISAVAENTDDVARIMEEIEALLTETYPNAFFDVTDAGSSMEAATASADTLTVMLLAVASIVFIVGGIGIMNVLFVTVKERTAEIGMLKAVGCSRTAILGEFLLEANLISIFGGIVGVLLSIGIIYIVEMFGIRMEPSAGGWILALLFAVLTGTVFGFYPAYRASRLNPIEALSLE